MPQVNPCPVASDKGRVLKPKDRRAIASSQRKTTNEDGLPGLVRDQNQFTFGLLVMVERTIPLGLLGRLL